jgi:hypothetical protein
MSRIDAALNERFYLFETFEVEYLLRTLSVSEMNLNEFRSFIDLIVLSPSIIESSYLQFDFGFSQLFSIPEASLNF